MLNLRTAAEELPEPPPIVRSGSTGSHGAITGAALSVQRADRGGGGVVRRHRPEERSRTRDTPGGRGVPGRRPRRTGRNGRIGLRRHGGTERRPRAGLDTGLAGGDRVLYLGAASGTTVSHVADFAGPTYAVEFAPRPARDLVDVAADRSRLFPLLADARRPETYAHVVESELDAVVQDVATRGQAEVALRNRRFLAPDGRLVLAVKARSEDVTAAPEDAFDEVLARLRDGYEVLATERLAPRHDAHLAVVARPD